MQYATCNPLHVCTVHGAAYYCPHCKVTWRWRANEIKNPGVSIKRLLVIVMLVCKANIVTRISRDMGNRNVDFFGVYTITGMLDKKITNFQPKIFSRNLKKSASCHLIFFLYVEYMNSYMKMIKKCCLHGT
jgi:hypothetical protein